MEVGRLGSHSSRPHPDPSPSLPRHHHRPRLDEREKRKSLAHLFSAHFLYHFLKCDDTAPEVPCLMCRLMTPHGGRVGGEEK